MSTVSRQNNGWSPPSESAWKRNLRIIWFAQLLGAIGMSACLPFLPLYVRELGISDPAEAQMWAGLVYSAPFLFASLITPFWGALGDRVGRKLMLIRAYIGVSVMTLLMALVGSVWQLFLLRLGQGAVSGFVSSSIAIVVVTTPLVRSGYALGFLQTALSSGNIVGPLIGGVCADFFGMRAAFYLVSGLCLISAIIVGYFAHDRPAEPEVQPKANARQSRVIDNVNSAMRDPETRRILLLLFMAMLGLSATQPVLAFYVESIGAPHRYVGSITGVLVGMLGLLGIIFAPYWGRRSDAGSWSRILRISAPVIAFSLLAQACVSSYLYLFPLRFVMGVFSASLLPSLFAGLSRRAPHESRGGTMALGSSATMLGQLISPVCSGWVAARLGLSWSFVIAAACFGIMLLLVPREEKLKPQVAQ